MKIELTDRQAEMIVALLGASGAETFETIGFETTFHELLALYNLFIDDHGVPETAPSGDYHGILRRNRK